MSAADNTTPVPAPSPEDGHKVFVGNLSFATTDSDLQQVFGKVGPIATTVIISRGSRSLGYGFVTFVHEESALTAIKTMDKSEIASRQVNVELAKPAVPRAPRPPKAAAPSGDADAVAENGDAARIDTEGDAPVARTKKPRAKRSKASRTPRTDGETEEAGDAPVDGSAAPAPAPRAPRAPRAPKSDIPRRVGPPTGTPSTTLLFVANLAFSVTDEMLAAVFVGFKVVSARIVTKKFGNETGRSKGFGFVEFENEGEQLRALESVQGKVVEEREIQLKIAINPAEEVAAVATEPEAAVVAA